MSDEDMQTEVETAIVQLQQERGYREYYRVGDLVRFAKIRRDNEFRVVAVLPRNIIFRRVNNCRCAAYDALGKIRFPQEDCDVCGYTVEFPDKECIEMGLTHA